MSSKGQMTLEIFQIFTWQFVSVHITHRKKLKAIRWSYLPFVIKHALFPLGTTSLLVSCSGLWGVCVQTFVKHANLFTTSSWWHDITSTKVSCVSEFFFGIKMPCHSMHTYACVHVVRQICLKIPSSLLHMKLTRTKVHKYVFSNRFGYALHVDVVQIWIMVIKWLEDRKSVV